MIQRAHLWLQVREDAEAAAEMTLTHRPMFQALIEAACRRDSTARALQARRKHALPALCTQI